MVSREAVPFLCFHIIRFRVRQLKGSRRAPLFLSFCFNPCILSGNVCQQVCLFFFRQLLFTFFDIVVNIQIHQVLRLFAFFISHAEGTCPSLNALQLILKHVAPSIALDNQQNLPPLHLIEIFVAVAPDLAYYDFEGLVGVLTFFRLPFPSRSSISGLMVLGTCIQSFRIWSTVVTRFCTSSRLA